MRRRRVHAALFIVAAMGTGSALVDGCAATKDPTTFTTGTGGMGGGVGATGTGGASTSSDSSSGTGGDGEGGLMISTSGGGGSDAGEDVMLNPCGSKCGPKELCDAEHQGLDDNCDGQVDEGCGCSAGQVHFCFKGDPSYHNAIGCYDGSEKCSEQGTWGPCIGGVHATTPDDCYINDVSNCHPISAPPFADVHLKTGTGSFSANAVAGSEVWTVACPTGISPCPGVAGTNPVDTFKPLQSGEYSVTYTKQVAGQTMPQSCTYPLFVGAPGLRVELAWEHTAADQGVDLDLHVKQPMSTLAWDVSSFGAAQDCGWGNCKLSPFGFGEDPFLESDAPHWFADPPVTPPLPVNWWLDPMMSANTCYYAPRGIGQKWQDLGKGCHNPRLDIDNITCDFSATDPNDTDFCTPENINIDFPPENQWTRIGVHYYSNHGLVYDVHPNVKIFCNGALTAELGSAGYYSPESPVTFSSSDGEDVGTSNRFWVVADVAFVNDKCGKSFCNVKPTYSDPNGKTPFFLLDGAATSGFAPAYPPTPTP
jgi:hypothetical protein